MYGRRSAVTLWAVRPAPGKRSWRSWLVGIIGLSIAFQAQAQPSENIEVGAVYPYTGSLVFLVPQGEIPNRGNTRTLIWRTQSVIDFDTGKESDISDKQLENVPRLQREPIQISGPVIDSRGQLFTKYFCWYSCILKSPAVGEIDGEKTRLEPTGAKLHLRGKWVELSAMTAPAASRNEYEGLQAVTATGAVKWAWVYLIQTQGMHHNQHGFPIEPENPVETTRYGDLNMLPGNPYFYLETHFSPVDFKFGYLTFRLDFATGLPVTRNPRIKAVSVQELQAFLDQTLREFDRQYPNAYAALRLREPDQAGAIPGLYSFWGEEAFILAEFLNTKIQQHWFKEIK